MYSVEIVQRASNGTVRVGAMDSIIYTSKPGFTGRDTFIYARRGRTTGNLPATRTVRVSVTVAP
jgi:hypothetical protein